MTLTEVVNAYLARQRSLGMRFDSAGQLLQQFSRAMGSSEIGEVTPEAVADFLRGKGALSATCIKAGAIIDHVAARKRGCVAVEK